MSRRFATLPRRKFVRLKGSKIEFAVGLLLASFLQARAAEAATVNNLPADGLVPAPQDAVAAASKLPDWLANLDEDALEQLSPEELKALLGDETLVQLGLDPQAFAKLLDGDLEEAIRQLEAAFRNKLKLAAAQAEGAVADGEIRAAATDSADDADVGSALGEGVPLLWVIGGLAAIGGIGYALLGGDSNDDPEAVNDSFTTNEDTPLTFDVRSNDSDGDGGSLIVTHINGTAITTTTPVAITGGTVSLGADGRLTFTPNANFNGAPSFTYTVSDGNGGTAEGSVALIVTAVNDAPVAVADTFTTNEDTAVTINVRGNDTDVEGNTLTVTQVNGTAITAQNSVAVTGGVVSLVNGNLVFTPAANFNGTPSFTYTVSDGNGGTATATVSGTVTAVNDAPVNTVPGDITLGQGGSVAIAGLSVTDVDAGTSVITTTISVPSGSLSIGTVNGGANVVGAGTGTITLSGTLEQINATLGAVGYTAAPGFVGNVALTITTSDGTSTDTDVVGLAITQVTSGIVQDGYVSGAKVFIDLDGDGVFDENEPTGFTDEFGRFSIATNASGNIVAFGGVNTDTGLPNTVTLIAPLGSSVVNPLTTLVSAAIASGQTMAEATASVKAALGLPTDLDLTNFDILAPGNDPAVALAAQKAAVQIVTVLKLAGEAGGAAAQSAVLANLGASLASGGEVRLDSAASVKAMLAGVPGIDAAALDQIAGRAAAINQVVAAATSLEDIVDTQLETDNPNFDLPPAAEDDEADVAVSGSVVIDVLANDVDPGRPAGGLTLVTISGRTIVIGEAIAVNGGSVVVGADGQITFTADPGFVGDVSFDYGVADPAGNTSTGTVNIDVAPDGPVLAVDAADFGAVLANADALADAGVTTFDIEGDVLAVSDAQAGLMLDAGIDFADSDVITVEAAGTQLNTTLKGLQDLHVDSISTSGRSILSLDVGEGGLGGLNASDLPQFDVAQSDAALDLTLNVEAGSLGNTDLGALAGSLAAAGVDHIGVNGDGDLGINVDQANALAAAGIDFRDAADVTLNVDAGGLAGLNAGALDALNIDQIDVAGDVATISDAQAGALLGAGITFADSDSITVEAAGTQLNTTLKGLQDLHVDSISTSGRSILSLDVGEGGLGALSASDLPQFDVAQTDAALDLTLNVEAGSLGDVDLGTLAGDLAAAGVDHLGVNGDGSLGINIDQANALAGAGIDFRDAANVTLNVGADALGDLEAGVLDRLNIDQIDVTGDVATISDAQASALLGAGIEFAASDDITVEAGGTQLNTTLKGLQDLHVDSISSTGRTLLSLDAGGSLATLNAANLPQFDVAQDDAALDVTLNIEPGDLEAGFDLGALASSLADAGIDHIGVNGSGELSLSYDQAQALAGAGLDFSDSADVTLALGADGVAGLDTGLLGSLNVDHLDATSPVTISDAQASDLVNAGIDFATADTVTVEASGTQLNTTLKGLQDLHVDAVEVGAGVTKLNVDAGDLSDLTEGDLPQFDTAQTDAALDVTLRVDLDALDDLERLAGSLRDAGVDHFAISDLQADLDQATQDRLDAIAASSGIDFVYGVQSGTVSGFSMSADEGSYDHGAVYRELLSTFEASDADQVGDVEITDGTASSLIEAGMLRAYLSDNLVVDATGSGDRLLTTLKEISEIGIDEIRTASQSGAPVYVDLGIGHDAGAVDEITTLFKNLDLNGPDKLFTNAEKVGLVLDAEAATALSQVDGAFDQLADLGFTEVDVLAAPNGFSLESGSIEVKLIGQNDDLYQHLHHER